MNLHRLLTLLFIQLNDEENVDSVLFIFSILSVYQNWVHHKSLSRRNHLDEL